MSAWTSTELGMGLVEDHPIGGNLVNFQLADPTRTTRLASTEIAFWRSELQPQRWQLAGTIRA